MGLKTGYTEKAGRTLVSAAERDGMTLIAVTLDDPDDWRDHAALFDWGFSNWKIETAVRAGEEICSLPVGGSLVPFCPVRAGADLHWPLREGERLEFRLDLHMEQLTAPVQKGVRIGTLRGAVGDEPAGEIPLVCGEAVPRDLAEPRRGLFRRLMDRLKEL